MTMTVKKFLTSNHRKYGAMLHHPTIFNRDFQKCEFRSWHDVAVSHFHATWWVICLTGEPFLSTKLNAFSNIAAGEWQSWVHSTTPWHLSREFGQQIMRLWPARCVDRWWLSRWATCQSENVQQERVPIGLSRLFLCDEILKFYLDFRRIVLHLYVYCTSWMRY